MKTGQTSGNGQQATEPDRTREEMRAPATDRQCATLRDDFDLTPADDETVGSATRRINAAYCRRRAEDAIPGGFIR